MPPLAHWGPWALGSTRSETRGLLLILDGFLDVFLVFGSWPKFSFVPVAVPPVPCPVPPVLVPNRSGFRFPVRFASFLLILQSLKLVLMIP